jgi:hypothetical protein
MNDDGDDVDDYNNDDGTIFFIHTPFIMFA